MLPPRALVRIGEGKLGKPLARNPPLTSLSLAHNSVEAKGAAALLGAMAENTTLRSLDLRNNLLGGSSGPGGRLQAQLEARCRLNEQRSTVANPVPATSVANPPPRPASRLATARGRVGVRLGGAAEEEEAGDCG